MNINVYNNNYNSYIEYLYFHSQRYKTNIHPNLYIKCEKYSENFNKYMREKGSFYYPNIFIIYDETVKELANNIMNDQIDEYIRNMDKYISEIYEEEVLNIKVNK